LDFTMIHGTGIWVSIADTVMHHIILFGGIAIMVGTTVIIGMGEVEVTGVDMIPIRARESSDRTGLRTLECRRVVTAVIIPIKLLLLQKLDPLPG